MLKRKDLLLAALGACILILLPLVRSHSNDKKDAPSPAAENPAAPSPAGRGEISPSTQTPLPTGEVRPQAGVRGEQSLDSESRDKMMDLAANSPDPTTRWSAVQLLVKAQDPETLYLLQDRILKDPDAKVRQSSVKLLANLEDPEAMPILVEALEDANDGVKVAALDALAEQGDTDSLKQIWPLEKSKNKAVKAAAEKAETTIRTRESK